MAIRVFLDANILFSAARSDGAVRALVSVLLDRGHACQVDAYGRKAGGVVIHLPRSLDETVLA